MAAATHPGAGQVYTRTLFSIAGYEEDDRDIDSLSAQLKVAYGVQSNFALLADIEFGDLSSRGRDESGMLASTFEMKYRLFKEDYSPLNTWMASVFAGLTVPGNNGTMDELDPYPRLALATTAILERHGINAELEWEERDDDPQRFSVNGSYLYRIAPVEYTAETRGA